MVTMPLPLHYAFPAWLWCVLARRVLRRGPPCGAVGGLVVGSFGFNHPFPLLWCGVVGCGGFGLLTPRVSLCWGGGFWVIKPSVVWCGAVWWGGLRCRVVGCRFSVYAQR